MKEDMIYNITRKAIDDNLFPKKPKKRGRKTNEYRALLSSLNKKYFGVDTWKKVKI